ncbi:MAG: PocR ligand-binding domain-containing protein [Firmicutes bacterium]|nr:PocR ligand-binding domain-containing protein [Bacillota bacterium]
MSSLGDLVQERAFSRILRSFREATGLIPSVVDSDGRAVFAFQSWEDCAVCRLVRASAQGRERCQASYRDAGLQAALLGDLYVFQCHAGLVNWAAPLMAGSEHVGSVISGQVTMWETDDFAVEEILRRLDWLGVDPDAVREAVVGLEQVSSTRVQAAAELLFAVASHIVRANETLLRQRQEIARQQAMLGEALQDRKRLEEEISAERGIFSRAKENELLGAVRAGDRSRARQILNDMLVDVFLSRSDGLEIMKARLLELAVFLSRAAVEVGADLKGILGLNYRSVQELARISTFEDLCFWMVRILDQFIDRVYEAGRSAGSLVRDAIGFMRENIRDRLSMDDIARAIHVSPSHLSHVFKDETGVATMDYFTGLRIQEAKHLLLDCSLSIAQVAEMVGYEDPAYFSRCFKRREGVSPREFRSKVGRRAASRQ